MLTAARLMAAWSGDSTSPAHRRLARLVAAIDGGAACSDDTLGDRNRRLLRLHRALRRGPLEACVKCASCDTENELAVPVDAILATPAAPRDARVRLKCAGRMRTFRLPRMSDIEAAARSGAADVRAAVLDRCRLDGEPGRVHEAAVQRLGRGFERLDPVANIVVDMACSGCGAAIAASVDVATLLAREIDVLVDALYRDVDRLASAYGWSEAEILALPVDRRQRYAAMASQRGSAVAARPG